MKLRHPELFDDFSKWLNAQPGLQPSDGINATDIDKVIHRYCHWNNGQKCRDVQCMLFLEVKAMGAAVRPNQADTMYHVHQAITTQLFPWQSTDESGRFVVGHPANNRRAKAVIAGKTVEMKVLGHFCLRMSGTRPDNSEWMEWSCGPKWNEGKRITLEQLQKLLRFELHPATLKPYDPARPHKKRKEPPSFLDTL